MSVSDWMYWRRKSRGSFKGADLFAPLPPTDDCAICLLPLSRLKNESRYMPCCGNALCVACTIEHEESIKKQNEEKSAGKKVPFTCPFCRDPIPTCFEEELARVQARCLQNDHNALKQMGGLYRDGGHHVAKDDLKALHYLIQAVELGSAAACTIIGSSYNEGSGVAVNKERAALFERVGALRGSVLARHNIGCSEYYCLGNHEIGIRHWKIAAEAGYQLSLDVLKSIYNAEGKRPGKEFIGKEEMDKIYRSGHGAQMEVKSEEREKHSGAKW